MAPVVKNPPANAGDLGLIPGLGRSPGGGHGNPLQYSCLGNPMDRGGCQVIVSGVGKSQTRLKQLSMHARKQTPCTWEEGDAGKAEISETGGE